VGYTGYPLTSSVCITSLSPRLRHVNAFSQCETHWLSMQVAAHCLTLCKGCFSLLQASSRCATLDWAALPRMVSSITK
jgi:hypothetical protein